MQSDQIGVFGEWDAPMTDDLPTIPVPFHLACVYCGEPFIGGDHGAVLAMGPQHRECGFRGAMGGIGHHVDHARYCGGEHGTDAGLTRRRSALLVWQHLIEGEPVTEDDLARERQV